MLMRLVDFLKDQQITALFTNLAAGSNAMETTDVGLSSLIDTWLFVRDLEIGGERNRGLYILKSRGMGHSNQIREFVLSDTGIALNDVYVGPEGVLTGSARTAQEAKDIAGALSRKQEIERRQRTLERKRKPLEAQMAVLRVEFEAEEEEMKQIIGQEQVQGARLLQDRSDMGRSWQSENALTPAALSKSDRLKRNRKPSDSGKAKRV